MSKPRKSVPSVKPAISGARVESSVTNHETAFRFDGPQNFSIHVRMYLAFVQLLRRNAMTLLRDIVDCRIGPGSRLPASEKITCTERWDKLYVVMKLSCLAAVRSRTIWSIMSHPEFQSSTEPNRSITDPLIVQFVSCCGVQRPPIYAFLQCRDPLPSRSRH